MTEGHPGFVANNGRIGFGVSEHAAYAPEGGAAFRLVWLAARRSPVAPRARRRPRRGVARLRRSSCRGARPLRRALEGLGLDAAEYHLLPVHPWQWEHRIVDHVRARHRPPRPRLPRARVRDEYRAQQSVRTMFNRTHPDRHYVKTALAVQNMGFLRGLSPAYMRVTPAINDWVADLVARRRDARGMPASACCASARRSATRATRTTAHPTPSAHRKMLAALWRESPDPPHRPRRAARHDGVAAAPGCRRSLGRDGARAGVGARRGRVGACVPARLPAADRALPARPRPRVHAARREPHPDPRGARARRASS